MLAMPEGEETTIHEVIERFRSTSLTNQERGRKFEVLIQQFLLRDPLYGALFDEVWLWTDWAGRDGRPDTGIDLVAQERASGALWAIQCKFYEPQHTISKPDIDSFLSASGKQDFQRRLIVSTTDRWNANAEQAIDRQQVPVQRLGLTDLENASVDWSFAGPPEELNVAVAPREPRSLRPHQQRAVDATFAGFAEHERGKLIMACGTGKTFTALAIAERTAHEAGGHATVLFLVPSLALLAQTLREWSANASVPLTSYAVCSDPKINKKAARDDFGDLQVHDLAIPATTDPAAIAQSLTRARERAASGLTVVFSTYQSIEAVHAAQQAGAGAFDLTICDEAHRTTGVTLAGGDESHFVRVHDAAFLQSARRLYMTATPRIFDGSVKDKAKAKQAALTSMDDEATYGPEFFRLGFGEAVEMGLLTDYKVVVLTVSERHVARTLQQNLAGEDGELNVDELAQIIGCWNALAKHAPDDETAADFASDPAPMRRAVAFLRSISASKEFTKVFDGVVNQADGLDASTLRCAVDHVDGTMNALTRGQKLDWLQAPIADGEARILSNARCLSEGVDVPDLDAVLFLSPRGSQVDVVQAVGRVMRKPHGDSPKKFGYIVLPVAVPAGTPPEEALRDSKRYQAIWQVLQALRAHDERFEALVNQISFEPAKAREKIITGHIDDDGERDGGGADDGEDHATQLALLDVPEWRDAIYSRIVQKVGERTYWEQWAGDIAEIHDKQVERIRATIERDGSTAGTEFDRFLTALRANLNEGITAEDAISMLSQHLITKPVFAALFGGYAFAERNPVSQVMDRMVQALGGEQLQAELETLNGFYRSVARRAEGIGSDEGKQRIITELYEQFFRKAFKKTAESLGIVYTPVEIVDFIIRAADDALRASFGKGLTDEGVHILDPFTGTGTFIVRLLQSGRIRPEDLARKYASELHANELLLLAYYIAAINIEAAYHAQAGGDYVPFEGIALTDTFQSSEESDLVDELLMPVNNARIAAQLEKDITVIVGNPPYSVGQGNANDNNQNLKYPTLDGTIERTYAARSTAQNKNSLYDSYIRAMRWASDRIGYDGVVAFVSNGGWIDGNTADGIRLSLAAEFSELYVYNLRGNQRTAGELSRKEGGKVFGQGSRNTVAILIAIRNPAHSGPATIRYRDIGDYLSREEKLEIVADGSLESIDWRKITPNEAGDWVHQRSAAFETFTPLSAKDSGRVGAIFTALSRGLETGRDAWVYAASKGALRDQVTSTSQTYERLRSEFADDAAQRSIARPSEADARAFIEASPEQRADPRRISWSRSLRQYLARGTEVTFAPSHIAVGSYRPFERRWVYYDRYLNHERSQLPKFFPTAAHENVGFLLTAPASHFEFCLLMTDLVPNLHLLDTGQFFPRYTYEPVEADLQDGAPAELFAAEPAESDAPIIDGYRRLDNITDEILADYQSSFGEQVTKDEIFHYVYAVLHSPQYREAFAADLKKMLPRIPKAVSADDFKAFADAGAGLAELHVHYEQVERYPLHEELSASAPVDEYERYRVEKMRYPKKDDRSTITYNAHLTLSGIPEEAYRYQLGSRSAIEWIIERYRVTTHKDSGITNDPNDWSREHKQPRYIVDLLARIVTVSLETMQIVDSLPTLPLND